MCYGIMNYYPREVELNSCVSFKQMSECEIRDWQEQKSQDAAPAAATVTHMSSYILALLLTMFAF